MSASGVGARLALRSETSWPSAWLAALTAMRSRFLRAPAASKSRSSVSERPMPREHGRPLSDPQSGADPLNFEFS